MSFKSITGFDANSKGVINVLDAVNPTDAVNLQQVQAFLAGLRWKANGVKAATIANGTLASAYANGSTLDGISLVTGDRILLKDQTTGGENGIYTVNAAGAPTRATDADSTAELENAAVFVAQGTVNADKAFVQTVTVTTVGTTAQTWAPFGGASTYTAGNGLSLTGSSFAVLLDTASGLVVSGTGLKVDIATVVRKYAASCVVTTNPQTFTHSLNSTDAVVQIKEISTSKIILADVTVTDANNISVDFGGAPTAAQYRVVVQA